MLFLDLGARTAKFRGNELVVQGECSLQTSSLRTPVSNAFPCLILITWTT